MSIFNLTLTLAEKLNELSPDFSRLFGIEMYTELCRHMNRTQVETFAELILEDAQQTAPHHPQVQSLSSELRSLLAT